MGELLGAEDEPKGEGMSDDPQITVVSMPMLDTGIGMEAGFRDDAHLREVAKAEREAMDPVSRELANRIDRDIEHAFLFGSGV